MDITDLVDYNMGVLNVNDLTNSFFCTSQRDPTLGFSFDASGVAGHTYPDTPAAGDPGVPQPDKLRLRLHLGSHFAQHLRRQLEEQKGYTSTVGISTSKLLSKLAGSLHKPRGQTTLMPPYDSIDGKSSNITAFLDEHEVGKIPGIGSRMAGKIREYVLRRPAEPDAGLVDGDVRESVSVADVRTFPDMGAETLERLLRGPGSPHGIGSRIWGLLNGIDDAEVGQAREVPRQISIEDSYIRLDSMAEVLRELGVLARSLIKRMRLDLVEVVEDVEDMTVAEQPDGASDASKRRRWRAHPRNIRLSTRPRPPVKPDGTRNRSFNRISRSAPLPNFVLSLADSVDALAEKLVTKTLMPLFRQLHPEKSGWNLSLVNVAVTNMAGTASDSRTATGRDIGRMLERQEDVLKQWRVEDRDVPPEVPLPGPSLGLDMQGRMQDLNDGQHGSAGFTHSSQYSRSAHDVGGWDSDDESREVLASSQCSVCGAIMPPFAMAAHRRFHLLGE